MNAESKQIRENLDRRLAALIESFGVRGDETKKLASVQRSIGQMIEENGDAERHLRQALEQQKETGRLRTETYQLISSLLDRYATEDVPTSRGNITYDPDHPPVLNAPDGQEAEPIAFMATAVLPKEARHASSADDQVQVGSVLRDRFLLQKRISGGAMGVVYKALDRRLAEVGSADPYVAIKVLAPQLAKSGAAFRALQQEAAKGRCLTHPNIVRFIDLDRENDVYFIVMEWLEGRTLADILDSSDGRSIGLVQSLDIVRQVGKALDYAHRCGIVHADVKPGNLMMLTAGGVKLFDFGIARIRQTQELDKQNFDPGVLGAVTPAYSSMQVLTGEEPVPADDVFSLGCLYYRLAAGHRVFGPRNAAEAAAEGMQPQRISELSDQQWAALSKSLSYSRVTRFATVAEFLQALDTPARDSIIVEAKDGLIPHATGRSKFWLLALAAMLALSSYAGYRYGVFDAAIDWLSGQEFSASLTSLSDAISDTDRPETAAASDESAAAPGEPAESGVSDDRLADVRGTGTELPADATSAGVAPEDAPAGGPVPIDFSLLPDADVDISLIETANDSVPIYVSLREDGVPVTVDLLRTGSLDLPLQLRIEEVGYSGNRSPWASGQYGMSTESLIDIPAGQDRARISLFMISDALREADQLSTLRIRPAESTRTQLASMEVVLEDDDQRRFEAELPANTVAFAVSQVAVRERDPAVQIDVLRFNPDEQAIIVGYSVRGLTATEGEDYFSPNGYSIAFGPQQRSARLLIPLVQDSQFEGDESFTVELATLDPSVRKDVFQRIIVTIRDDEIADR